MYVWHYLLYGDRMCRVLVCQCTIIVHTLIHIDFGSWVTLTELNLGTNQLTSIPEDIQELTRLEVLVLSNNAIRVSSIWNVCPTELHVHFGFLSLLFLSLSLLPPSPPSFPPSL